jgi:hypothetical protein
MAPASAYAEAEGSDESDHRCAHPLSCGTRGTGFAISTTLSSPPFLSAIDAGFQRFGELIEHCAMVRMDAREVRPGLVYVHLKASSRNCSRADKVPYKVNKHLRAK